MATEKKIVKVKFYVLQKEIGASDKCPPQARLIVETVKAAGGKIEREALLALLKRPVEQGGLKTGQTAERILGFYRPKLKEMGVMLEVVKDKEIEVQVPDKPAPAATAAAPATTAAAPAKGAKGTRKEVGG